MSDQEIISALKQGNQNAFKHVYSGYGMVENYILNNSGNREDARDLYQNALIIFYRKIKEPEFELNSKISTYVFSIVKNLWLKKITRNKETTQSEFQDKEVEENDFELDKSNSDVNVGSYLSNLLQKIGDPCKSLITLFHFDKLEWEVIAEKLNYKTAHAARNQKYKCFLKIRKLIPETDRVRLFESML